jgi:hypothetical protein
MDLAEITVSFTNSSSNYDLVPGCLAAILDRAGISEQESLRMLILFDKLISEKQNFHGSIREELIEIVVSLTSDQLAMSISLSGRNFSNGNREMIKSVFEEIYSSCLISSEPGREVVTLTRALRD